jgi:hypothetical protein
VEQEELAVVSFIAFDKTPSIDINDLTSCTIIATEHIKATNTLSEALAYFIRPRLFFFCQLGNESDPVDKSDGL